MGLLTSSWSIIILVGVFLSFRSILYDDVFRGKVIFLLVFSFGFCNWLSCFRFFCCTSGKVVSLGFLMLLFIRFFLMGISGRRFFWVCIFYMDIFFIRYIFVMGGIGFLLIFFVLL